MLTEGPLDHLDHAPTLQFVGGKLGIDATAKTPAEGAREWPAEIEMSAEVRELVDRRWAEYGIPRMPTPQWCRMALGAGCGSCYVVDTACEAGDSIREGT